MYVIYVIRLARVRRVITARHQRSPSELSLARDRHARAAAVVALARSLYRARGVAVTVAVAIAVAVGHAARHVHHASRARTRASLPRVPRIITVSIPRCHPRARVGDDAARDDDDDEI